MIITATKSFVGVTQVLTTSPPPCGAKVQSGSARLPSALRTNEGCPIPPPETTLRLGEYAPGFPTAEDNATGHHYPKHDGFRCNA